MYDKMNFLVQKTSKKSVLVSLTFKVLSCHFSKKIWKRYMSRRMRKPTICIGENKNADQLSCAVTAQLISAFISLHG